MSAILNHYFTTPVHLGLSHFLSALTVGCWVKGFLARMHINTSVLCDSCGPHSQNNSRRSRCPAHGAQSGHSASTELSITHKERLRFSCQLCCHKVIRNLLLHIKVYWTDTLKFFTFKTIMEEKFVELSVWYQNRYWFGVVFTPDALPDSTLYLSNPSGFGIATKTTLDYDPLWLNDAKVRRQLAS